ncbi:hybrid sensor histidine kinase/response regulator [Pseudooceanicola sediminis]|uniref:histidine kinase n=1 Tax=Pseudooceanicola sediminis TaxID=2211117 RepID=A0A399IXC1_9RHOB|nr:PAS-domain containing protein [Pseudooceanicola sediminis]KAA2312986.1 PAS domain-containing sensor histidine kinase [Puniceibacterium sp. HSS470]RII37614.1 hybrid sensor histidine kinase/response regulator [Pseudooceanicola sediminis]|tara:strand:- start:13942 stop:15747 length:1806 start_codon:yes stop_codon:yes gene_type:complete
MSISDLVDPADPPARQIEKLMRIAGALMTRVQQDSDTSSEAYAQFQRAALLEQEVRVRTRELETALDLLNQSNDHLAQANRETEAARSNLANAIEAVEEGFALFSPNETLILCNARFGMHMPDLRPKLLPGLSFSDYVTLVSRSAHLALPPDETPDIWLARRMARHHEPHVMFNVRLTGHRWLQVSEHRTPDGGIVILQTDVTDMMRVERKERARMLDDQAQLVRATLEHLDQGVCIFDKTARLVGWNRRVGELLSFPMRLLSMGIHAERLIGWMSGRFTLGDGSRHVDLRSWISQSNNRPPLQFEVTRSGTPTLAVFAQEMPDNGFVISFTDVTAERAAVRAISGANERLEARVLERTIELEAALAEAERANASKSRFVAAASHDLLQPLSAAKLFLASVEESDTNAETAPVLGKARRALESVEHLMGALLDISKLDSGRAEVHVTAVSLHRLMQQLGDEMAPLARQKGLCLNVVPSSAVVASDATYLRRILQNLLSNALRYTESGTVLLGARRRGNHVMIEVRDTGLGIPADQQKEIFREFSRLNATVSSSDGMGLGLAIVERACLLLGHTLTLESEERRGSIFRVAVPVIRFGTPPRD